MAGFPRITRPRRRKNADGFTGFSLVDPAGNWIRVMAARPGPELAAPEGRLARSLADAVVLADSHGDVEQAAKILGGAVRRHAAQASQVERVEALAYLAELALRRGDRATAEGALADIDGLTLSEQERVEAAGALVALADLRGHGALGGLDAGPGRS
jgi:hypothetical protein